MWCLKISTSLKTGHFRIHLCPHLPTKKELNDIHFIVGYAKGGYGDVVDTFSLRHPYVASVLNFWTWFSNTDNQLLYAIVVLHDVTYFIQRNPWFPTSPSVISIPSRIPASFSPRHVRRHVHLTNMWHHTPLEDNKSSRNTQCSSSWWLDQPIWKILYSQIGCIFPK